MTRATHVLSSLRRLPALALVAAALAGGMTLTLPQTHAQAADKPQQICWYWGWFKENGQMFYGEFSEPC